MKADATVPLPSTGPRHGDINGRGFPANAGPAGARANYSPELPRAALAKDRAVTACEHGRHPSASVAESGMAHRINAAMNAVKAAGGDATRNTGWGKPGILELSCRHDPVLVRGDARNRRVRAAVGAFFSHSESKAPMTPVSPPSSPVLVPATARAAAVLRQT
jgi:hypothetical protein